MTTLQSDDKRPTPDQAEDNAFFPPHTRLANLPRQNLI